MSGPAAGGEHGDDAPLFTEINVTPLTDIFLVLLIIFMVTATGLSAASLDVALPKAAAPGSLDVADVVTVSVDAKDRLFIGKTEVTAGALAGAVRAALAQAKEPAVVLAGDRAVPLDKVVAVMEAARKAGAKRFAIAVAREEGRAADTASGAEKGRP
jgi:biopolymer transport protein ExbD